ncbi:hypothetical protein [Faecalimicrobium dakarense]|uniref:hypothetical protein n=1 Tax=Faecalimicrobium dakarense TaxID=1301100 RepID=UPI0004B39C22|nr:hypothetical protein [[Clostridium] dakarense]
MKNKLKYIIPVVIIVGIIVYFFATPIGALRFAVLRSGYPKSAVTLKLSPDPNKTPMDLKRNQTFYTITNPPFEEPTQTPLENWVLSKYGPFYWGEYFGW